MARRQKRRQATLDQLTPFARELQEWLATQRRPDGYLGWTHAYLADRLPASRATVDAWFRPMVLPPDDEAREPTLPGAQAFHRLHRLLDWPMEKLLALTGYSAPTQYVQGEWDALYDDLAAQPDKEHGGFDPLEKRRIQAWLESVQVAYQQRAKRPARAVETPAPAVAEPVEASPDESGVMPTPLRRHASHPEPVGSGK